MTSPTEFSQSPNKPISIAVVGGGIAGVTLTLGLLQHRIPVTLYEAAPKFGEIGAGVSFGPNALRAMKLISPHIHKGFENRATHNRWTDKGELWFTFRFGESCDGKRTVGQEIAGLECEGGQGSIHRAHFLDEMVQLLPNGVAEFGKRCIGFEQDNEGVELKFQDGTTARHDAVVGCDGIKSKMRSVLLGAEKCDAVFSGKYAYRGLIPMDKAEKLLGEELALNGQMFFGRHGHVLTFPIERGRTMNVVAFSSSDEWNSKDWVVPTTKEEMIHDFQGWGETVTEILNLMERPDIWALFNHPPASTYYKGRVCILGDAAHASTPHQGAGAGMAIEDSYIVSNLLAEITDGKDLEAAFKAYDTVRRPRSQKLVTTSREAGQLYDLELEGNDPRAIATNLLQRMKWIWNHDLTADLSKATELLRQFADR